MAVTTCALLGLGGGPSGSNLQGILKYNRRFPKVEKITFSKTLLRESSPHCYNTLPYHLFLISLKKILSLIAVTQTAEPASKEALVFLRGYFFPPEEDASPDSELELQESLEVFSLPFQINAKHAV